MHSDRNLSITAMALQLNLDIKTKKRPELWPKVWILHHDNAPAQKALSVKQAVSSQKKKITEMENPPCFPDLVPSDFSLFLKIKSSLKGGGFQDTENIQKM
jgi:hypothetical protein